MDNFKEIYLIKNDSVYDELALSGGEKSDYLFGYSQKGYVAVF